MLVDPDEYVIGAPENEKDDLAVINPDELNIDDVEQLPSLPLADDCTGLRNSRYMVWGKADLGVR